EHQGIESAGDTDHMGDGLVPLAVVGAAGKGLHGGALVVGQPAQQVAVTGLRGGVDLGPVAGGEDHQLVDAEGFAGIVEGIHHGFRGEGHLLPHIDGRAVVIDAENGKLHGEAGCQGEWIVRLRSVAGKYNPGPVAATGGFSGMAPTTPADGIAADQLVAWGRPEAATMRPYAVTRKSMPADRHAPSRNALATALLAAGLLLSGCAAQPDGAASAEPVAAAVEAPETPAPPARPFPVNSLYELLAAEFAGIREQIEPALEIYINQAHETRDPAVIERAIRIASFVGLNDVVLNLAELWVEVEPANLDVRRLVAFHLARAGRVIEAFPHAEYLLLAGDDNHLQALAAFAGDATLDEKQRLLVLYE